MKRIVVLHLLALVLSSETAFCIQTPAGVVSRSGDQSVVVHWDPNTDSDLAGYRVYRSLNSTGPFVSLTPSLQVSPGFCDLSVSNGRTNFYQITAVSTGSQESLP